MWYKNIAGRFFGLVTNYACDRQTRQTDRQNYDSQDRTSIAVSRSKKEKAGECVIFPGRCWCRCAFFSALWCCCLVATRRQCGPQNGSIYHSRGLYCTGLGGFKSETRAVGWWTETDCIDE